MGSFLIVYNVKYMKRFNGLYTLLCFRYFIKDYSNVFNILAIQLCF